MLSKPPTSLYHRRKAGVPRKLGPVHSLIRLLSGDRRLRRIMIRDVLKEVGRQLPKVRRARVGARVLLDRRRVRGPMHARERDDEAMIELLELRGLLADDVADLAAVLGGQEHAHVARVRESGDALEELALGKLLGEREERGADCGCEVDLLGEADAGIVLDDSDGFMHPPREIEGLPVKEVGA